MQHDRIAVIDFGGQYAHLIATKIRRLKVRADIVDPLAGIEVFRGYRGIIISGSPAFSAHGEMADYTREIYDLPIPILGLCFGHQEIAKHYGGRVEHARREYGFANLRLVGQSPIFAGLGLEEVVWMSHYDSVTALPPGFVELGHSTHRTPVGLEGGATTATPKGAADTAAARGARDAAADETRSADVQAAVTTEASLIGHRNAAIASETLKRYGFQFHPEVDDTEHGELILENFAVRICGCRQTWTVSNYIEEQEQEIRTRARDRQVFLLASGGVDSTVCARLLVQALGPERVHLLHIDNGLMRKDESRQVVERFRGWGITDNLHFVDASGRFLSALKSEADPERKRVAIGNTFIEVCEEEMEHLGIGDALLAQGTIYPDTIETGGTSRADVIKTHHNRVPMVVEMVRAGRVIEPLRDLYKVEVRELGAVLGLDRHFLERHPFPGPGLGVRLLCSGSNTPAATSGDATPDDAASELERINREADRLAAGFGLGARALPIRSVGVKGDLRSYEWPVFLYGPSDASAPWHTVLEAANRVYMEIAGVNRCVYDLTLCGWRRGHASAPPRFELLEAYTTRERLDLLRQADAVMMDGIARHGLIQEIWQCPTVMLPISLNGRGTELVVLRPVLSARAMTARPAELPPALVGELREKIMVLKGVSGLCIDVTTKPPGTIEWE